MLSRNILCNSQSDISEKAKSIIISPTSFHIAGWGFSFPRTSYIYPLAVTTYFYIVRAVLSLKFETIYRIERYIRNPIFLQIIIHGDAICLLGPVVCDKLAQAFCLDVCLGFHLQAEQSHPPHPGAGNQSPEYCWTWHNNRVHT